jgi:hypothetical protein
MVYPTTTNKGLQKPDHGTAVDVWDVPLNYDFSTIDFALGGTVGFNATDGSKTLSADPADDYNYIPLIIEVTGQMNNTTGNVVYTIPAGVGGVWIVRNFTTDLSGTGPWTVSFVNATTGLGVAIPRGYSSIINSDGSSVFFADSRTPSAAGSDRQVQFNSGGYLGASVYFVYTASAKVGIGTATPKASLTVQNTDNLTNTNLIPEAGTNNAYSNGIGFNVGFDGTNWTTTGDTASNNGGSYIGSNYGEGAIKFITVPSTGSANQSVSNTTFQTYERARITSAGNFGIGTKTPSQKLEVAGTIYSTSGGFKFPDGTTQTSAANLVQATPVTSTSGTSIVFGSIPSYVKRVTIMFEYVGLTGSSDARLLILLGTAAGFGGSTYNSTQIDVGGTNQEQGFSSTSGLLVGYAANGSQVRGAAVITQLTPNTWSFSSNVNRSDAAFLNIAAGTGALSDVLTQISITSLNGTDTFNSGVINIMYE